MKFNSESLKKKLEDIGFWAGVAMSIPFYSEFVPYGWAAILMLPLVLGLLAWRTTLRLPNICVYPILIIMMSHLVALLFSSSQYEWNVIKELVITSLLLCIYIIGDEDSINGFFCAIIPLGVTLSVFGLLKATALDRGYLIRPLLEICQSYPTGSAFCNDYNMLALIFLVSIVGCISTNRWMFVPLIVAAGLLSGSRRFIVLSAFLPVIFLFLIKSNPFIKICTTAAIAFALVNLVSNPTSFEEYRFGDKMYKVIPDSRIESGHQQFTKKNELDNNVIKINRSTPSAMVGTLNDGKLGTSSRTEYWKLGLSLAAWLPSGLSYHEIFSCTFSSCDEFHYPHMPIISEWIIGGFFIGILSILFYVLPVFVTLKHGSLPAFILILFTLPFSLISGDTILSVPMYIACVLVALNTVRKKQIYLKKI